MANAAQMKDFYLTQPSQVEVFRRYFYSGGPAQDNVKRIAMRHFLGHFQGIDFSEPQNAAYLDELLTWFVKLVHIGAAVKTQSGFELSYSTTSVTYIAAVENNHVCFTTVQDNTVHGDAALSDLVENEAPQGFEDLTGDVMPAMT